VLRMRAHAFGCRASLLSGIRTPEITPVICKLLSLYLRCFASRRSQAESKIPYSQPGDNCTAAGRRRNHGVVPCSLWLNRRSRHEILPELGSPRFRRKTFYAKPTCHQFAARLAARVNVRAMRKTLIECKCFAAFEFHDAPPTAHRQLAGPNPA
jgi:hypothetical protein